MDRNIRRRFLGLALVTFVLGGCVPPVTQSLSMAQLERLKVEPRDLVLAEVEVVDARPEADKKPLVPTMQSFVPLLVWFQWSHAGDVRPDAKLYSTDVPEELGELLRRAFEESGFLAKKPSPDARKLHLKVVVDQLYGLTHVDSEALVTLGYSSTTERTFAPYGFASARVQLSDEAKEVLLDLRVSGTFDPDFTALAQPGAGPVPLGDQLSLAAVQAAGSLATNVVRAVEPALAGDIQKPGESYAERSTFFISRLTDDGLFVEVAGIEFASGRVISDMVVKRWMEPYSAAGEWVLDPYQGGKARLPEATYAGLVKHVAQTYDVRFVSDVRTAHFFGVNGGALAAK